VLSNSYTIIIGVTGGVGAGKSVAQNFCDKLGFPNTDVDKFVHEILDDSKSVNSAILERFNSQFNAVPILNNGLIDRNAIAEKVFNFDDFKLFLENLIHPLVKKFTNEWICSKKAINSKCAFIFVPLLFESGMDNMVDVSINISASVNIRTQRLIKNRGWDKNKIMKIIDAQLDDEIRSKNADFVIDNNCSIKNFEENFYKIISSIIAS